MTVKEFFIRQMSESGEPSNNRVMLFLFLSTVMILIMAVVIVPLFKPGVVLRLPDVPPTFETFVEWIVGILVFGSAAGKGIKAYQGKGSDMTSTKSETITEIRKEKSQDEKSADTVSVS